MSALSLNKFLTSTAGVGLMTLATVITSGEAARAVNFGTSWDGPGQSLQEQLDAITVGGPNIDTVNDQTGFQLFTNTASGGSVASFMFEIAGFAPANKFGIYNANGVKAQLFGGANDVSDQSFISFNNGDVAVSTIGWAPGNAPPPSAALYQGFGNVFGFYLENGNGETFYSEASRNQDGYQQSVIYQGNNQTQLQIPGKSAGTFTENEFIIAFEDLTRAGSTDHDFNDMVVMVESVKPVPEPATLAGLGLVAGALGLKGRRKASKTC
ncbi:DUF4114 domain-containing protein [Kamptonema formosum]|uniref:DUF4114 domain-containing protein n=1 Tax=Kamptonema formosum TaxID=331992 RepID=UPI0003712F44|nr:DUF4114 domain-containing protein [Oscillatoria sp. PCC 10802]